MFGESLRYLPAKVREAVRLIEMNRFVDRGARLASAFVNVYATVVGCESPRYPGSGLGLGKGLTGLGVGFGERVPNPGLGGGGTTKSADE